MSTELSRLSELAKAGKTTRFLSLAHLLTPAALMAAFEGLRKDASAGVDDVTYREYEQDVWRNIPTLHHRLVSHQYRVQPLRRVYIPKENGKERPISIPALEDKIVQKATVTVLNAIYEQDFRSCSYGFRPGRSPHDALDAIRRTCPDFSALHSGGHSETASTKACSSRSSLSFPINSDWRWASRAKLRERTSETQI
jgi:hypothetical protein